MKVKLKFNSLDCIAIVKELQSIQGSRVNQIYDVDNKTYLLRLNKSNSEKVVLLIESGVRLHLTKCDWPKNVAPSGFTMKLRKHISNKRITYVRQLGTDRIIDMQFGSGEVAFHIILELYSRGNIILTDYNFTIISLLRSFVDGDTFNFAVHETYPINSAKNKSMISADDISEIITSKKNVPIKRALLSLVDLGSSLLEHALIKAGFDPETKMKSFSEVELKTLEKELIIAGDFLKELSYKDCEGHIIYEKEIKDGNEFFHMFDFNPCLFIQHEKYETKCFESFNEAVDEYYSKVESQKIELKLLEQEKEAMKKVNKIREDQSSRLEDLFTKQQFNKKKAELIMTNASLVDDAINILRSAIASQMSWRSIKDLVDEATRCNDPVASLISAVKLEINQISMKLSDPFAESTMNQEFIEVDLDLSLSAYANAKRYYDDKKYAALKERKTLESQKKALKSAEKKARETLKTIKTQATISKTRKIYWFEKFYWFISSENYLIIGGRDQKQNEVIVKRYMKAGDLYVHADVQGASSVIIKNPSAKPVPPRTLDEAGLMAVCFSNAWSSKILFNAWWVYHNQVSKTAPSGEYLVTGSFMIRGQKNYLLPQHLQLGFSFLFKVDESSVHRHTNERKIKVSEDNCNELDDFRVTSEDDSKIIDTDEKKMSFEESSDMLLVEEENSEISSVQELLTESCLLVDNSNEIKVNVAESEETDLYIDEENISEGEENDNPIQVTLNKKKQSSNEVENISSFSCQNPRRANEKTTHIVEEIEESNVKDIKYKRGQKSRQKKIKEKYKDQDEEEKQLRMSILKSAGTPKSTEKKNRRNSKKCDKHNTEKGRQVEIKEVSQKLEKIVLDSSISTDDVPKDNKPEDEDETTIETNELDMLNALTGQPHEEDEILFALPIVAPYTSVLNNKYKVKMIPGMTKRGKAARSAVETFLRSKECNSREKHVMKSVNDQLISRNFPGKVKILIPQGKKK